MIQTLTHKTIHGIKWNYISTITNTVLQIGYTAIMARLLDPKAFGLVAMAGVVLSFGSYFAQMGMGQALIQKKELTKENIRAAFTSLLLLSIFFLGLIWILAPFATLIFNDSKLIPIIRVLAISFLLNGISTTALSLMRRDLKFKQLSIITMVSYVLSYLGVGVLFALLGYGVWSLILATLSQALIMGLLSYFLVRHNVRLIFRWKYYKPLFSFGGKISVISFLEFISASLDTLLIGKILGPTLLGIYNRAFSMINLPMYYLTTSFSNVLFSSFSTRQDEKEKLAKGFLTTITFVSITIIPIGIGISIAAKETIMVILGAKWIEAIPILRILALAIPFSMLLHFGGVLCDATARLKIKLYLQISYIIFLAFLMFLLKGFGLKGFAYAIMIGEFVRFIAYSLIERKILNIKISKIFKAIKPGFFMGLIVALVLYGLTKILTQFNFSLLSVFICQIVSGAITLFLLIFIWFLKYYEEQNIDHYLGQILTNNQINYLELLISKIRIKLNWS